MELKESIRQIFEYNNDDKELESISRIEIELISKDCTMVKGISDKKSLIWTVDIRRFDLTNKSW